MTINGLPLPPLRVMLMIALPLVLTLVMITVIHDHSDHSEDGFGKSEKQPVSGDVCRREGGRKARAGFGRREYRSLHLIFRDVRGRRGKSRRASPERQSVRHDRRGRLRQADIPRDGIHLVRAGSLRRRGAVPPDLSGDRDRNGILYFKYFKHIYMIR